MTDKRPTVLDAYDDLPAALRYVRAARGMTVHEAGKAAGLSGSTISRIERNDPPSVGALRQITLWLAEPTPTEEARDD